MQKCSACLELRESSTSGPEIVPEERGEALTNDEQGRGILGLQRGRREGGEGSTDFGQGRCRCRGGDGAGESKRIDSSRSSNLSSIGDSTQKVGSE